MGEATSELKVADDSMMQLAYAVCQHIEKSHNYCNELTIIEIDELCKHLEAYTESLKKIREFGL